MIGDTVAIEVPETVSEQNLARALGACEAALGLDQCIGSRAGADTNWMAQVSQTSVADLSIELVLTGQLSPVVVRVLSFENDEPEAFRWQSVGVVVAALVLSQEMPEKAEDEAADSLSSVSETVEVRTPDALPPAPRQTPALSRPGPSRPPNPGPPSTSLAPTLDVAALLAAPVSDAPFGAGGWLNVGVPLAGPLLLLTQADLSWSRSSAEDAALRGLAFGASMGAGLRWQLGHPQWFGELSARAAFQGLRALGEASTARETAWTVRWGGRGGALLAWFPGADWGLVLGGDAGLLWPPLEVSVTGRKLTSVSSLVWGGYLGLRVRIRPL